MRKHLLASALALGLAAGLTACSQHTPDPAPTASASGSPTAKTATCSDGVALLRANDQHGDQPGCDRFNLMGTGNTLSIGETEQLTIEGDGNTVTVESVEHVTSTGKDNTVYYDGDEPDFDELGTGTKVLPSAAR